MKVPYGPHQRARRRRRRCKVLALSLALLAMVITTSPALTRDPPPPPKEELTEEELAGILRDCKISLFVAEEYGKKYPEHAEEFVQSWRDGWNFN